MRLRRRQKKTIDIIPESVVTEHEDTNYLEEEEKDFAKTAAQAERNFSRKKSRKNKNTKRNDILDIPKSMFRKITDNPNFNSQLMVIIFSLMSDNGQMNRPLDNMTTAIDKVRNISDVMSNTMQSVKVASDVPKQIRSLLK